MREKVLAAFRLANRRYLQAVLQRVAPDRHDDITLKFESHMAALADFCISAYGGSGSLSTAFIRQLHKSLFPPGYRYQHQAGGKLYELVPGEYREGQGAVDSLLQPGVVMVFAPPEDISAAMETAVVKLNAALLAASSPEAKRDAVLWFIFDFSIIHPFGDANGRMMCMLCDLLLIKEGLAPFHIDLIKEQHREDLYRAGEHAQRTRDLSPLYAVIARYNNLAALANDGRGVPA